MHTISELNSNTIYPRIIIRTHRLRAPPQRFPQPHSHSLCYQSQVHIVTYASEQLAINQKSL